MTYAPAKFEAAMSNGLGYVLTRNTLFDLDLEVKVNFTQNVVQCPLHHLRYTPVKFEDAVSNGLGGDRITRNVTGGQTD